MTTDVPSEWTRPPEWLPEQGHSVTRPQDRNARGVGGRARGAARPREGAHEAGRRAGAPATRAAVGPRREGLPPRHRRRPAHACGAVRRPQSAAHLPLHVRPELPGRLPDQLVDRGQRRRPHPAPERARRDDALRVAGPTREAAGVQAAHGLERSLGVVGQQRVQPRPRLLEQRGGDARVGRARASRPCRRSSSAMPARAAPTSSGT